MSTVLFSSKEMVNLISCLDFFCLKKNLIIFASWKWRSFVFIWLCYYLGTLFADPFIFSQHTTRYVYTYTSCGSKPIHFASPVSLNDVEVLVVGGGGAGGSAWSGNNNLEGAGGGGAGRMDIISIGTMRSGSLSVGCGGAPNPIQSGSNGGDSFFQFSTYNYYSDTVPGGGGGAYHGQNGVSGGSSGGSTGYSSSTFISDSPRASIKNLPRTSNFSSFGNAGGNAGLKSPGGGGGGAGSGGGDGSGCNPAGGNGQLWTVTGMKYAGGGSGGLGTTEICNNLVNKPVPGVDGGGTGGFEQKSGSDGSPNTGGGGGGGGRNGGEGGLGGSGVVAIAFTCPPGYEVDKSGNNFCESCSNGKNSTGGMALCFACRAGKYASNNHTTCITCADGTFSTNPGDSQGECAKCVSGKYASSDHTSCRSCPPGSYCEATDTCQGHCNLCSVGTFCESYGCITCSSCASITSQYTPIGSTGCACPSDMQNSSSLFSILIQSDLTLRSFTQNYNTTSPYDVELYIKQMLNVELDENGDGDISRDEVIQAMKYRSLQSTVIAQSSAIPLWKIGSVPDDGNSVRVSVVYDTMLANYYGTMKSFDGSGSDVVASITTDYPNSSWTSDHCNQYDAYNNPNNYSAVQVNWGYYQSLDSLRSNYGLLQVCAYVNGQRVQQYSKGSQDLSITNFMGDKESNDLSYKRVYCIVLSYKSRSLQYVCTVGLYYVSFNYLNSQFVPQ